MIQVGLTENSEHNKSVIILSVGDDIHGNYTSVILSNEYARILSGQLEELTHLLEEKESNAEQQRPEGWLRAVDEELVSTHLGVADIVDSYEIAKKKLGALIDWHVQVATDPVVNGGWKLIKAPTEETK